MNPLSKAMIAVAGTGAGLFALSGVFAHAHQGVGNVLGAIGWWFGFLACALGLVGLALAALGRGVVRRAAAG